MTDPRNPLALLPSVDPRDEAGREARHQLLRDLLAAYADGELPRETVSQLDAHLVGCAPCRRELALHQAVARRLAAEPVAAASVALRARVAAVTAMPPAPTPAPSVGGRGWRRARTTVAAGVVLTALLGIGALWWRDHARADPALPVPTLAAAATVPLLRDALADHARVSAAELPGRARDLDAVRAAVPFAVEPLRAPALRLLGAWTTSLADEPAAVLAYRWDDRVVLQYIVSEERFFRAPAMRAVVAAGGAASATDGARGVLAWPTAAAGTVLVAEVGAERLATLLAEERLAQQQQGRGAH